MNWETNRTMKFINLIKKSKKGIKKEKRKMFSSFLHQEHNLKDVCY